MTSFETTLTVLHFAIDFAALVFAYIVVVRDDDQRNGDGGGQPRAKLRMLRILLGAFAVGLLITFVIFSIVTIASIQTSRDLELRIMQAAAGQSATAEDIFARVNKNLPPATPVTPKMEFDALMKLVEDGKLHPNVVQWQTANGVSHSATVYGQ